MKNVEIIERIRKKIVNAKTDSFVARINRPVHFEDIDKTGN